MCLLKKCCCGCSLRTGCWIIAILCLISYTLSIIGSLYSAIDFYQKYDEYRFFVNDGYENAVVTTKLWVAVVFSVTGFISGIFLIHGTKSSNVNSLWVYFYIQLVFIVLSFIMFILLFVLGFHWIDALPYLIGPFFNIYMIIVVKSYAIELKDQNSGDVRVAFSDIEASNNKYHR